MASTGSDTVVLPVEMHVLTPSLNHWFLMSRRLHDHLQHKATPPVPRHEGQNTPKCLYRWTAKEGERKDQTDH